MAYETIIVDIQDHISVITLNRPDALNALNDQLLEELGDALGDAQKKDKDEANCKKTRQLTCFFEKFNCW